MSRCACVFSRPLPLSEPQFSHLYVGPICHLDQVTSGPWAPAARGPSPKVSLAARGRERPVLSSGQCRHLVVGPGRT